MKCCCFVQASAVLGIIDHLRCGFARFKLGTHFLDLGGLLSELGCESLYLFLLLRDRCLQLLNFVIQHGLALEARGRLLRFATRHRCVRRRRCGTRVVRVHTIDAKLAESIHSNLTNGDAVSDLGVRGDTVDKAGSGTRKDAADAYDAGFVPR